MWTLLLLFCPLDQVEGRILSSHHNLPTFSALWDSLFLEYFLNVFKQWYIILLWHLIYSLCCLGPAALEHRIPCFPTPCTRVLASVLEAGRPDLMVTGPPTNSSILLVYFSSCRRLIQPSLNSVLDDTRVHRLHSSNIFCRISFVESYWWGFTLNHSSRFLLRPFPFSYLTAPQSNFQCWITCPIDAPFHERIHQVHQQFRLCLPIICLQWYSGPGLFHLAWPVPVP